MFEVGIFFQNKTIKFGTALPMGAVWQRDPEPLLDDGVFYHIFRVSDQLMKWLKSIVHVGRGSGGHFLLMREQTKFNPEHWAYLSVFRQIFFKGVKKKKRKKSFILYLFIGWSQT